MDLGHIYPSDRKILYSIGVVALVLTIGLIVTGIWQFLYHEPSPSLAGYKLELDNRITTPESSGMAWVHGFMGDMGAILTLFGGAWFMVRVSYRFSWFTAGALIVLTISLLTGGVIRFNATVKNGQVDVVTGGYAQFFTGEADYAVTDRATLSATWTVIWTVVHVLSIPVLMASALATLRQMKQRRAQMRTRRRSAVEPAR